MQNNTVWMPVNYMSSANSGGLTLTDRKNVLQETVYNSGTSIYGVFNYMEACNACMQGEELDKSQAIFEVLDFRNDVQEVQIKILDDQLLNMDLKQCRVAFAYEGKRTEAGFPYVSNILCSYLVSLESKPILCGVNNEH